MLAAFFEIVPPIDTFYGREGQGKVVRFFLDENGYLCLQSAC